MAQKELDLAKAEYVSEYEEAYARIDRALIKLADDANPDKASLDLIYREVHTIKGSSQLFGFTQIAEIAHAMEACLEPYRANTTKPSPAVFAHVQRGLEVMGSLVTLIKRGETPEIAKDVIREVVARFSKPALDPVPAVNTTATLSAVAPAVAPAPVSAAAPSPAAAASAPAAASPASAPTPAAIENTETSTVRVSVALLDRLMGLTGEMVLVRNQVLQYASRADELEFLNLSQRLDVVTSEMQAEVMKTRMQPVGNVMTKFQRVVRDLARELNKKIELSFSGMETELDRTLLEAVKDPIMHIVRNSCDHGLEKPEERRAKGKPESGTVAIRAFQEGGHVILEIADDGRGLDRDKLIAKAIEKGILSPEGARQLSDRDAFGLIFAPGFSTAAAVTNVSGRGVGMDVVRTNIEGIGGTVELNSELGFGTTLRLKIPLTLAIVPAMIVRLDQQRYVIPQSKITELVRVESGGATSIEMLQGQPIFRLRGNILPLVSLAKMLGRPEKADAFSTNIAVLNAEGNLFGLMLDEVLEMAEVVVKPLGLSLPKLGAYSGATVLGDGTVALILDVQGIAAKVNLVSEKTNATSGTSTDRNAAELQEFLLIELNSKTKHALPLNLVHRLEEVPRGEVKVSGNQRVIRYRNNILPIISVNECLGLPKSEPTGDTMSLIVSQKSGQPYGLEVNDILDVLRSTSEVLDAVKPDPMILGNLIDSEEVIVLIDVLHMMDVVAGDGSEKKTPALPPEKRRILFAEDTVFFRRHVSNILTKAGYDVVMAEDGAEALAILRDESVEPFDMLLSDIEMPRMNGLELIKNIRREARWANLPAVALTTKYDPRHKQEGLAAGFNAYLEKLKSDVLLTEMASLMTTKKRKTA